MCCCLVGSPFVDEAVSFAAVAMRGTALRRVSRSDGSTGSVCVFGQCHLLEGGRLALLRAWLPAVAPAEVLQWACSGSSVESSVGPVVMSLGWPSCQAARLCGGMGCPQRRQVQPFCWLMRCCQAAQRLVHARLPWRGAVVMW